ncbi:complement component 1 Q subcomponent-binding protein, mitochondrial isoform X2 [Conger conger]|uniref:complement component 1 Q subcomponent-binding protein, mitochondrial isoform X2 n=1 Tax=Conger conger TaxID=82655 RepID=UPI002A5A1EDE|nr:complement component 1 Q subcomponent-binding protein, mitochondrial isoform X2 [Conger conger]
MLKSLARVVTTAARFSARTTTVSWAGTLEPLGRPALCVPNSATIRPFTRSIWMMRNSGSGSGPRPTLLSRDKAFAEFLSDELKEERKIKKHQSLPKMSGGWDMDLNGTEAKLIRTLAGEKVTVTFNINNSIPPNFEEEENQGQKSGENEPEIVSTPNFVVEVTKHASNTSLVFDCHYPEDEASHGEGEEESDIFAIREVSFQPIGEADWKETSYTLNTDSLDWALYDHLMDFLADRGVDNTFADELIELSTALEHQEYIGFLENLSGFVKCS